MSNLEARKEQIEQFFKAAQVNGVERTIHFVEPETEGEAIIVELRDDRTNSVSIYLSIPVVPIPQSSQEAVIADILSKLVTPSECGDMAAVTMLHADGYEDASISEAELPDLAMDRLVAAWIAWRTKQYKAPVSGEEALGDLDDHPF